MKKLFLLLVMVLIGMTACQKDPISRDILYEVSFAPTLNGEVVPWVNNDMLKSFETFQHKYATHVIRILNGDTWVADVPIISYGASGNYMYPLLAGTYSAMVIPVTDDPPAAGRYTLKDIRNNRSFDVAMIFTTEPVSFTVGAGLTEVILPCVNEMACFQFDLGGTVSEVGVPNIEIYSISTEFDMTFLTAHNGAGSEQATPAELQATTNPKILPAGVVGNVDGLWYDDEADIYYLYMIPGADASILAPTGNGGSGIAGMAIAWADYLTFDFDDGGSILPTFWMLDYYTTKTWLKNTTLRISYSFVGASFNVTQQSWFETIVTP